MKKLVILLVVLGVASFFLFSKKGNVIKNVAVSYVVAPDLINKEGRTIATRTMVPEGFLRKMYPANSFSAYIQNYPLKPSTSKVITYDGKEYVYQRGHAGVLEVPVPSNGLQQCADALIRLRAEYLWKQNRKKEIGFNFTSGHYCS